MKKVICKIFGHFLYRGMKVLYKKDSRVKKDVDMFKNGVGFALKFGIEDDSGYINIRKTENGLKKDKKIMPEDIVIEFKTLDLAYKTMTGGKGLCDAYAEHDFILKGSINDCMAFTRVVEVVMTHLLPKKVLKKILREVPERKISVLRTYCLAIFGN